MKSAVVQNFGLVNWAALYFQIAQKGHSTIPLEDVAPGDMPEQIFQAVCGERTPSARPDGVLIV